jgi:homotetrameric cytidine deaminase
MMSGLIDELWRAACEVRTHAYAPYSGYPVGAAIALEESDTIHTGCNVENSSYGATLCAERSAVLQAVAASGPNISIRHLVLVTRHPAPPCGLCLQVLSEFSRPDTSIYLCSPDALSDPRPFASFLPHPFSPDSLTDNV